MLPLSLVVVAGLFFIPGQEKRGEYEKLLHGQYADIPRYSEEELKALPGPDRPDIAAYQDVLNTQDPVLGRVPAERRVEAYIQTREMVEKISLTENNSLNWEGTNVKMGGRTRALLWDPNDASGKKVWAAGVTGGLWYNNDITSATSAWQPVDDFWTNLSVSRLTFDPNNSQVLYAGTGEAQTARIIYRESSGRGYGIMKSIDGGLTWNLLPSTKDFAYVTDVVVRDENGTSVIYAGVVSGIYKGVNHQSMPGDGLYRSTDGGINWEQVLPMIENSDKSYAVADIELTSTGRIFVGTMRNLDGNGGASILMSGQGTSGSWTVFDDYEQTILNEPVNNVPGRVMIGSAPSDGNRVYALVSSGETKSNGFIYSYGTYILRSDNGGESWTEKSIPPSNYSSWASIAWHALTIDVDQNDADNLFVGGLDLYRSGDGGGSWNHVSDWAQMYYGGGDDYVHADQHNVAFKPGSSSEAIFGCDGGVFYTSSANNAYPAFQERNLGYNTLQFYTCDITPQPGGTMYVGGLQDNGTLLYQDATVGIDQMINGGDGAYCFFDEDASEQLLITSVYNNQYKAHTLSGGTSYLSQWESGTFVSPADYDSQENTLYANACDFYGVHEDQLLRITGINSNAQGEFISLNTGVTVPFTFVKLSQHSTIDNKILFVGSQSGRLFKVANAQAQPQVTEITGTDFPQGAISCVSVGGSNDTLLVSFSNYGVISLWQSVDGGTNWINKEANLPDMPVRWCMYHPNNTRQVLLATEVGVWSTHNMDEEGVLWKPEIGGMAHVRVDMLQMRNGDNMVLAATHGRGLYVTQWNEMNAGAPVADFVADKVVIEAGEQVTFSDLSLGSPTAWSWNFTGGEPAVSSEQHPVVTYAQAGDYDVSLTVTNANGEDTKTVMKYIIVGTVGVDELSDEINVYPNPVLNSAEIALPESGNEYSTVSILDMRGALVQQIDIKGNKEHLRLDLSQLNSGSYIMRIQGDKKVLKKIFIKQ